LYIANNDDSENNHGQENGRSSSPSPENVIEEISLNSGSSPRSSSTFPDYAEAMEHLNAGLHDHFQVITLMKQELTMLLNKIKKTEYTN